MTHEATRMSDMDDYFSQKFYPIQPLLVINRSYIREPTCDPEHTLFDGWKELPSHPPDRDRLIAIHRLS